MQIPLWFPNDQATILSVLLTTPDGWLDAPVVVLCGGDNAPKAGGQELQIASALADRGIASLLLDFSAHGYPSGPLDYTQLTRPIEDLGSTFDALRLQRGIDVGEIGVSGSDVAGTVALLRASFDPRIRALALRATPAPANQLPTATLSVPTLLIVGNQDKAFLAHAKKIEQWLSGPQDLQVIDGAGRDFAETGVWEVVQKAIVEWFVRYLGTGVRVRQA